MVASSQQLVASKIRNFTDLQTWQVAHKLVLNVYLKTKSFPKDELYGLTNQMRRSAVSVTSNIAEGFGRRSVNEKLNFYNIAAGSLTELENQVLVARDVRYLDTTSANILSDQVLNVSRLLSGLIRSMK